MALVAMLVAIVAPIHAQIPPSTGMLTTLVGRATAGDPTGNYRCDYNNTPAIGDTIKVSVESIARMNDTILDRLNGAVGKKDRLWVLGDFAVRSTAARMAEFRERIRCRDVRMVWGNHDDRPACRGLFTACYDAVMVHIPDEGESMTEDEVQDALAAERLGSREVRRMSRVYLSHYAHVVWQASHKGVYHLYGHSHGNLEAWRERTIPSALSFDVGVDVHDFRPWSWEEIHAGLAGKRGRVPPHAPAQPRRFRCPAPSRSVAAPPIASSNR